MWAMATNSKGSARTAPKGHATPARNSDVGGRNLLTPTVQWILVVLVGLLVMAVIFYFGSDLGSGGGGGDDSTFAPTDQGRHVLFSTT